MDTLIVTWTVLIFKNIPVNRLAPIVLRIAFKIYIPHALKLLVGDLGKEPLFYVFKNTITM